MKVKSQDIFYLTNTPEKILATHVLAHESIGQMSDLGVNKISERPPYTIWISREEDIHDFLYQIPDLAWDMMEYAEEPLDIIYPKRKFISILKENNEQPIAIRLVKQRKLVDFVKKHGPLACFSISDNPPTELTQRTYDMSDPQVKYRQLKSMKLFADGSFTFVR